MSKFYTGESVFSKSFNIRVGSPIDDRLVVGTFDDLISNYMDGEPFYTGLLVYVVDEKQLYVLTASQDELDNASFEYEGDELAEVIKGYWKKIEGGSSDSNITFDEVHESGNGISINNTQNTLRDYVSLDNLIKSDYYYSSMGLNTYEDSVKGEEYIILSNGGSSYIKLFDGVDGNWIQLNIVDDSLGFTISDIKVKTDDGVSEYINNTPLSNGTQICFGKDIDFTGFSELRPNGETYTFGVDGSTYEDVDIYVESKVIDVVVYKDGEPTKLLTEVEKVEIDEKISNIDKRIENIASEIMVDPDGEGSESHTTLQEVIVSMNDAINKLGDIDEIESVPDEDIEKLFNTTE